MSARFYNHGVVGKILGNFLKWYRIINGVPKGKEKFHPSNNAPRQGRQRENLGHRV